MVAKVHLFFLFRVNSFRISCKSYAIVFVHFRLFISSSFCQMKIVLYFCRRKLTKFKPNYNNKSQNFRKWFKNGLKTQKLLAQGVWGKLGEVLFLFLLQLTLLNQIIQSQDFGILLFK